MDTPQLWLLAGGNGAGKSTFYSLFLEPLGMPFVNADVIASHLFPESPEQHSYDAAIEAGHIREAFLEERKSFCFETVFSHPSKIDFVGKAKARGYAIFLVVIHVDSPALNQARVSQRVIEGGHNVPPEKIQKRIPRTLKNLSRTVPLCDQVYLYDNSSADEPYIKVATWIDGSVQCFGELPEWARAVLQEVM